MGSEPYTPWDDEIIDAYRALRAREIGGDPVLASVEAIAEVSRWMTAHGARVRKEQRERDAQIAEQRGPVLGFDRFGVARVIAAAIREDGDAIEYQCLRHPECAWPGSHSLECRARNAGDTRGQEMMTDDRSIEELHADRESGKGCPDADGGPHYFAFIDPMKTTRICIDCGADE